jgi:hypothetical protein
MYLVPVILARKSSISRLLPWLSARLGGIFIATVCGLAPAQEYSGQAGTAEFQYLETLVFSRPAGLAGAYTSLAQGIDAVGYNPAGVSRADNHRVVAGTFRYHLLDVASGNASYAYPGARGMNYAFSAAYINYGKIEALDEEGNTSGKKLLPVSFNPSFTGAKRLNEKVSLGLTLKGLSEYLGDFEGSQLAWGWGVDAGLLYQPSARNIGFGLALLNLGRKEGEHYTGGRTGGPLPASLKGGFYYSPFDLPKAKVVADAEIPWYDAPRLAGGIEYAYNPSLTLRAGSRIDWVETRYYFLKATDQRPGELQGGNALKLASGFTFQADDVVLDYAVQYWYGLSWVHALTVKYALL